ncbi:hypothetical protein Taro_048638 [Colocasia esculenta]|uniref:Uncharacterized protein n=1 Tax=Colocasia esculenta TaxID=4460 RepID=A0A843X8Q2_COLES|nr:hypothetical protein [Colocasia esculenta]
MPIVRRRSHLVVPWFRQVCRASLPLCARLRWFLPESCVWPDLSWWSWRCVVLFRCLVVPCCRCPVCRVASLVERCDTCLWFLSAWHWLVMSSEWCLRGSGGGSPRTGLCCFCSSACCSVLSDGLCSLVVGVVHSGEGSSQDPPLSLLAEVLYRSALCSFWATVVLPIVPTALDGEGLVILAGPCSRGSPPHFLQLGAHHRRSSVSDGLQRRLWCHVVVSSSESERCELLYLSEQRVVFCKFSRSVGGDANFGALAGVREVGCNKPGHMKGECPELKRPWGLAEALGSMAAPAEGGLQGAVEGIAFTERKSFAQIILASKTPPSISIEVKAPSFTDSGEPTVFFSHEETGAVEGETILGEAQDDLEPVAEAAAVSEAAATVPAVAEEASSRRIEDIPPEDIEPIGQFSVVPLPSSQVGSLLRDALDSISQGEPVAHEPSLEKSVAVVPTEDVVMEESPSQQEQVQVQEDVEMEDAPIEGEQSMTEEF